MPSAVVSVLLRFFVHLYCYKSASLCVANCADFVAAKMSKFFWLQTQFLFSFLTERMFCIMMYGCKTKL